MSKSITPIGSCRIHNPVKSWSKLYGLNCNNVRNYGYTHTSAEALQQIIFMLGKLHLPSIIWPYVSPKLQMDHFVNKRHEISNIYIVEISSLKKVTINGYSVQLNYLSRAFPGIMGSTTYRKRLMEIAKVGDEDALDIFLCKMRKISNIQEHDVSILRNLRYEYMDVEQVAMDITQILRALPRVIFQTHLNVPQQDGTTNLGREKLISVVKDAVSSVGGDVYDPTHLMHSFGPEKALEVGSTTHFTEDFQKEIVEDIFYKYEIKSI